MRGPLFVFLGFVLGLLFAPEGVARAQGADADSEAAAYAETLVERAHAMRLAERRVWLRLGHYRTKVWGTRSDADGPDFFLAPDGASNPSAELDATLRGFFKPPSYAAGRAPVHPICRFPARLAVLAEALEFERGRLRMPRCEKFEEFWKSAAPHSATLVFSSFFISNPASAFGHTFLRINRDVEPGKSKREELLDHGIDYSAHVDTTNALLYGLKGLLGLFPGTFNMYPYYYKVREYNDFESRDLWEYDLNLTRKQVLLLTAHIWELGSTYFNYYYIDENCSYHILTALEAALPDVDITSKLRSFVIPADTVRALTSHAGLVANVRYRPSLRHVFETRTSGMTGDDLALVSRLVDDVESPLPSNLDDARRIRVLDAAVDLNDIRWAKELVKETDTPGARRKQRLLERRAEVTQPSPDVQVPTPALDAPHLSHGSGRVTLASGALSPTQATPLVAGSAGAFRQRRTFYEFGWRAAGHDLTDPSPGQPDSSRLDFVGVTARYYPGRRSLKGLELTDLTLARIESLTPLDRFTLKATWKITAAAFRIRDRACAHDDCLVVGGIAGGGLALSFLNRHLITYAIAETGVMGSGALDGIEGSPFRLDVGPTGGFRLSIGESFRAVLAAHAGYLPLQDLTSTGYVEGTLRWRLARDVAIGVDARSEPRATSAQLSAALYY